MDDILDELAICSRNCRSVAAPFRDGEIRDAVERIVQVTDRVAQAWSNSFLGYHAYVYYRNLERPPPGEFFDANYGARDPLLSRTSGDWRHYDPDELYRGLIKMADLDSLDSIGTAAIKCTDAFARWRIDLLSTLDVLLEDERSERLAEIRRRVADAPPSIPETTFQRKSLPRQVASMDRAAMSQGIRIPPHVLLYSRVMEHSSCAAALEELAVLSDEIASFLTKKMKLRGRTVARKQGKIFIGHGRSNTWRDLKDLLKDRIGLEPIEFNLEPSAGVPTVERLAAMMDEAVFAFLIMTSEDEHADGTKHARENVIHEAGLFQGRLGFRRAIILLEEGCSEFSNIHGLGHIRFPPGNILAKSEEIRAVLEREGIK